MFKIKALAVGLYLTLGSIAIGFAMKTPEPTVPEKIIAYEVVVVEESEPEPEIEMAMIVEEHEMDAIVIDNMPEPDSVVPDSPTLSEEEINLIALITMAEAEGESEEGKRLVIDTILNRVDHERFPDTVTEVIYQKSQFSCVWNGRIDRCVVKEDIVELVKEELENRTNSEVMFFRAGDYSKYGAALFPVGNHYFSRYA